MTLTDASGRIQVVQGDITRLPVDAIVNAANSSLLGGGGVDGAIHRAAGPTLLDACRDIRARQGSCPPGDAVLTHGGRLRARYVIHAVGPVWRGGHVREAHLLARCYRRSLTLAAEAGVQTIAFPAISCGIYGYPVPQATRIALREVRSWLASHDLPAQVTFCCFTLDVWEAYEALLHQSAPDAAGAEE